MNAMPVMPMRSACYNWPPSHLSSSYRSRFQVLPTALNDKKKGKNASFAFARLFGPTVFEESKLSVVFMGVDEEKHPGHLPRAYTITHSDITARLTLAVSQTINRAQLQGWYNRLHRDEVVAEWKMMQGKMSLHVHCHISGGHFLLDFIANLRYYIFSKELPVVLKAVVHGDGNLFNKHPELEGALVSVNFHSNLHEFNRIECWGPIKHAAEGMKLFEAGGGVVDSSCGGSGPIEACTEPGKERKKKINGGGILRSWKRAPLGDYNRQIHSKSSQQKVGICVSPKIDYLSIFISRSVSFFVLSVIFLL